MNTCALLTGDRPESVLVDGARFNPPACCRLITQMVLKWGGRVFFVGGLVRDLLLQGGDRWLAAEKEKLPTDRSDWDMAVDLRRTGRSLVQLMREVCRQSGVRYVFYKDFLTGTITLPDLRIDISHTRDESYPRPAILPEVKPAGIEEDLRRRDFTINALAIEMVGLARGRVVDLCGGQDDLKAKLVRIIHPDSFIFDPTRIFRCIRFAIRLDFKIESGTGYLMRSAVKEGYPALLTPERVLYELRCICKEKAALKMFEALVKERVLERCWKWRPADDFFTELKGLVQAGIRGDLLFIYLLSRLPVAPGFPVTREEREAQAAIRNFSGLEGRLRRARRRSTIYRYLKPVPVPALKVLTVLKSGPIKRRLELFLRELINIRPDLKAQQLIDSGIKPGPQLGRILEQLLYARLDRRVQNRSDEMMLVRRLKKKDV